MCLNPDTHRSSDMKGDTMATTEGDTPALVNVKLGSTPTTPDHPARDVQLDWLPDGTLQVTLPGVTAGQLARLTSTDSADETLSVRMRIAS